MKKFLLTCFIIALVLIVATLGLFIVSCDDVLSGLGGALNGFGQLVDFFGSMGDAFGTLGGSINEGIESIFSKREVAWTLYDVEEFVHTYYYTVDGEMVLERWQKAYGDEGLPEITGFTVYEIDDVGGAYQWYYVEFEPEGYLVGMLDYEYGVTQNVLFPYESSFKKLDIPLEDRYLAFPYRQVAMRGGVYVDIDNEVKQQGEEVQTVVYLIPETDEWRSISKEEWEKLENTLEELS